MNPSKPYSNGEEIGNYITHFIGVGMAITTYPILILKATQTNSENKILELLSYIIFSTSLVLLYSMSSIYHLLRNERAKKVFKILDHSAIFILIAGTITAFVITALPSNKGYIFLAIEWGIVLFGTLLKIFIKNKSGLITTPIYIMMGFLTLVIVRDMIPNISRLSYWLMISMAITYSFGVIFYVMKRVKFTHFVFHIFVLAGSILSFLSIYYI